MITFRSIIFFLLFQSLSLPVISQAQNSEKSFVVKSLIPELLVYDESKGNYVPFINSVHYKANTISFFVEVDHYKDCVLELESDRKISIFIDHQLYRCFPEAGRVNFDLKEIKKSRVFVSVFGLRNASSIKSIELVSKRPQYSESRIVERKVISRVQDPYVNVIILVVILIFIAYAVIRLTEPKIFSWYFDIGKIVSNTTVDLNVISGVVSGSALLLALLNSVIIAFSIALYLVKHDMYLIRGLEDLSSGSSLTFTICILTLIVCVSLILKFLLLRIIGGILGSGNIVKLHFFEFNRLLTIIAIATIPLSLVAFYGNFVAVQFVTYCLILLFLVLMLRVIIVINRESGFRIIYLFSYICTTEIIPVLILAKYFRFGHF